jgi:hypothetical protein
MVLWQTDVMVAAFAPAFPRLGGGVSQILVAAASGLYGVLVPIMGIERLAVSRSAKFLRWFVAGTK